MHFQRDDCAIIHLIVVVTGAREEFYAEWMCGYDWIWREDVEDFNSIRQLQSGNVQFIHQHTDQSGKVKTQGTTHKLACVSNGLGFLLYDAVANRKFGLIKMNSEMKNFIVSFKCCSIKL